MRAVKAKLKAMKSDSDKAKQVNRLLRKVFQHCSHLSESQGDSEARVRENLHLTLSKKLVALTQVAYSRCPIKLALLPICTFFLPNSGLALR